MKIGRNDPCPCGSGKKYKKCCLPLHERRGAGGPELGSFQEAEEYMGRYVSGYNQAPLEDFSGLSPNRMQQILTGTVGENKDFVEPASDLTAGDVEQAELVAVAEFVIAWYAENGGELTLTDRGNYRRRLCADYYRSFVSDYQPGDPVPIEDSLPGLTTAHSVLVALGYVAEEGTKSFLTTEGVQLYRGRRWGEFYREAFVCLTDFYHWQSWLPEEYRSEHFDHIQNAALFLLYLLKCFPSGTVTEFYGRFVRAFPEFVRPARNTGKTAERLFREILVIEFFYFYTDLLGFVDLESSDRREESGGTDDRHEGQRAKKDRAGEGEDEGSDSDTYTVTPLFRKALRWKV